MKVRAVFRLIIHALGAAVGLAVIVRFYPAWAAAGFHLPGIRLFSSRDDGSSVAIAVGAILLAYCFCAIAFATMDLRRTRPRDDVTPFI